MTDYKQQAKDFLQKYELSLKIVTAVPQKAPLWHEEGKEHGVNYYCTLSNKDGKEYGFDYWGSIADKENNFRGFPKSPTAYDVLACLDTYSDGFTFEDFCHSYGYDTDSRKAEKTFKDECVHIDDRADAEIERIEEQRIEKKDELAATLVDGILNKFI